MVFRGELFVGWVWRTTSGAVWGSLSCTPRLKLWAAKLAGAATILDTDRTRMGALAKIERALERAAAEPPTGADLGAPVKPGGP